MLAKLPKRLTHGEVASRLGTDYQATRRAIKRFRYPALDGRKFWQNSTRSLDPARVNWKFSNAAIARLHGVSRERVRQLREKLGKPFVESRGYWKKKVATKGNP